jgi:hypothetical protein
MDTVRGSYFERDRPCADLRDLGLREAVDREEIAFPALAGSAFTARFDES